MVPVKAVAGQIKRRSTTAAWNGVFGVASNQRIVNRLLLNGEPVAFYAINNLSMKDQQAVEFRLRHGEVGIGGQGGGVGSLGIWAPCRKQ